MKKIAGLAIALFLGLAIAMPVAAQDDGSAAATAATVLDRLDAGDFEGATEDFNTQMKASLGAIQLAGVQMQIETAGAVQSRSEPTIAQRDGYTVVVYRIQREHAAIEATIAIDGEGKVAGLHFAPVADTTEK